MLLYCILIGVPPTNIFSSSSHLNVKADATMLTANRWSKLLSHVPHAACSIVKLLRNCFNIQSTCIAGVTYKILEFDSGFPCDAKHYWENELTSYMWVCGMCTYNHCILKMLYRCHTDVKCTIVQLCIYVVGFSMRFTFILPQCNFNILPCWLASS